MSLSEGVSASLRYKKYASGIIDSNTQPVTATDPGPTGGQLLRRVSSTVNLTKDTYQSNEVRTDRQISDFRHGVKRVTGMIQGEFSPGTYWDFIEAAMRGTSVPANPASQVEMTSVAADATLSTFTFAGGDPVAEGYRVGDILRFTTLSEVLNNNKNFLIVSFGGTTNRTVTVHPAPVTMAADTAFTMSSIGASVYAPSTGHVSRKFLIEAYHSDIDMTRVFTECRIGGVNFALPATGMATIEIPVMGRDMEVYSGSAAPFLTSPAGETGSGIFAAVNGLLMINNEAIGVVTGLTLNVTLTPTADPVVGQNFVPEVFLGRVNATGQATVMLEDDTFLQYFKNETEISILTYLTTSNVPGSPNASIYMPRVKFGDAAVGMTGEGAQIITMPFQALKSTQTEATTGVPYTTVRFTDSEAIPTLGMMMASEGNGNGRNGRNGRNGTQVRDIVPEAAPPAA